MNDEITLADIEAGSIIVVLGKLAIVEEVSPRRPKNPIAYKNNTDHRGYICGLEQVQAVLGKVDLDKWKGATKPQSPVVHRASRNDSWAMPENLRDMGLKKGDIVEIRGRNGLEEAVYGGYNSNRPKNPISLEMRGKSYKGPAHLIVRKLRDGDSVAA